MKILEAGQVISNRYQVQAFLNAGGMQEVYIATDSVLERNVALKTPFNASAAKRFHQSAELAARVNHPNVAKTIDYLVEGGREFLVEELIGGPNLETLLETDFYYFDPHLLSQFGHQFSMAIQASHHVGVVHRDLKPRNIIVDRTTGIYAFKVTDFGIAKLVEGEFDEAAKHDSIVGSGSSTIVGALPFMAPELIENHKQAAAPADVWAFGAILYRLMSGTYPFGTGLAAIPMIYSGNLPAKPPLIDNALQFRLLGNELWSILVSCLNKDPQKRPTAAKLVQRFGDLSYSCEARIEAEISAVRPKGHPWGFLHDGKRSLFFHEASFFGDRNLISNGQRVFCSVFVGGGYDRAHPVLPLKPAAFSASAEASL